MNDYFTIQDLVVGFRTYDGEKLVLDIDRLTIQKGEFFGLVGESGVGKTVLAQTILGLLTMPPAFIGSGAIIVEHHDLLKLSSQAMQEIRGRKIAMIFQDPMASLNPVFTVGSQLVRVLRHRHGVGRKKAVNLALEKLEMVQLPDADNVLTKYPHELSGGQRQRIIIALALSCGAEFLIADEPTRNLDVTIQAGILKLIARLQKDLKMTVLFIANNLGLVSAICDHTAILHRGRVAEVGPTRQVLDHPQHDYTKALLRSAP